MSSLIPGLVANRVRFIAPVDKDILDFVLYLLLMQLIRFQFHFDMYRRKFSRNMSYLMNTKSEYLIICRVICHLIIHMCPILILIRVLENAVCQRYF